MCISSCFRGPKFQIVPGEHAPLDLPSMFMLYHSVHSKEGLQIRVQKKFPVHSFEYNLTILMRKQKCKQGMWK